MIVSWWSYSTPLWYRTMLFGERPDVRVVDDRDRLDENLGTVDDVIGRTSGSGPSTSSGTPSRDRRRSRRRWEIEVIPDPMRPAAALPGGRPAAGRPDAAGRQPSFRPRLATMRAMSPDPRRASPPSRTSSRPTTRRPTSRPSSRRRSRRCRRSPSTFEIIAVDDGSRDAHARRSPTASPPRTRASSGPSTTRPTCGYGAALRSGFRAARYDLVCFTDGDRQFRVADLGRLTARLAAPGRARRRRRLPDQARRPADPDRLRAHSTSWPTGSSSASGCATSTAPASSSGARRSRASGSSRAAPSSRPSC